jgi:hypothetical protein
MTTSTIQAQTGNVADEDTKPTFDELEELRRPKFYVGQAPAIGHRICAVTIAINPREAKPR